MIRCCMILVLVVCFVRVAGAAELSPEQAKLYSELEASLSGSALAGHFTVTGKEASDPKPERYELKSVKHVGDGNWMFVARIKYGDHDVTLPITLPIKWAGDTPVITVDKMGFPGLGTYTARVMIYEDHYAGFWSGAGDRGDNHGGHLYGVVERGKAPESAAENKSENP